MAQRPSICIFGAPNSGKTSAMKSLAHSSEAAKRVLYINADNKALPWFGSNDFTRYTLQCPTQLPSVIEQAGKAVGKDGKPKFDTIIVDTITRVMDTYASKYIGSKEPKYVYGDDGNLATDMNYIAVTKAGTIDGMSAWGRSAALFKDIMEAGDKANCQMIYISHMTLTQRPDGSFIYEAPLQGAVGKVGLTAWFSIAMVAKAVPVDQLVAEPDTYMLTKEESRKNTGHRFVFQIEKTSETQDYPIRAIDGMYPSSMHYIDNDMGNLLKHLDNLYAGNDTGLPQD